MSLLIVVTIFVIFPPLNFSVVLFSKKYLMAFLAGHSGVIIVYGQAASIHCCRPEVRDVPLGEHREHCTPQYYQIFKKVGQMSAMLQECWPQYFM